MARSAAGCKCHATCDLPSRASFSLMSPYRQTENMLHVSDTRCAHCILCRLINAAASQSAALVLLQNHETAVVLSWLNGCVTLMLTVWTVTVSSALRLLFGSLILAVKAELLWLLCCQVCGMKQS